MNDASNLILKCFLHTSRLLLIVKLTFFRHGRILEVFSVFRFWKEFA